MPNYLPLFSPNVHENAIPPRFQWNNNGGYCGETSFIASGLYYGQYLSQYDVRSIASPGMKQNEKAGSVYGAQLLLGVNDRSTADSLRLKYEEWPRTNLKDTTEFMQWVKNHVLQGHPVIMGVFNNFNLLGEGTSPTDGDAQYDHIVPVLGFGTKSPHQYNEHDIIVLSDNGLYTPGNSIPFYHQFRMKPDNTIVVAKPFLDHRRAANNPGGNVYSVLDLKASHTTSLRNYAIAITGVKDQDNETVPVRVTTDLNYEIPAIACDSKTRPTAIGLNLSVRVSNLQPNTEYNLYEYDDETKVPISHFNLHAGDAKKTHKIKITEGDSYTKVFSGIESCQKVFFRAVPASAQ